MNTYVYNILLYSAPRQGRDILTCRLFLLLASDRATLQNRILSDCALPCINMFE